MTNLTAAATFDDVYQIETTDLVLGGAGGIDNLPHQALLNRTTYLKAQVDAINGAGYVTAAAAHADAVAQAVGQAQQAEQYAVNAINTSNFVTAPVASADAQARADSCLAQAEAYTDARLVPYFTATQSQQDAQGRVNGIVPPLESYTNTQIAAALVPYYTALQSQQDAQNRVNGVVPPLEAYTNSQIAAALVPYFTATQSQQDAQGRVNGIVPPLEAYTDQAQANAEAYTNTFVNIQSPVITQGIQGVQLSPGQSYQIDASFIAFRNGYVMCYGAMNCAAQPSTTAGITCVLQINGATASSDNTLQSQYHMGAIALATGQHVDVTLTMTNHSALPGDLSTSFTSKLMITFQPAY